VELTTTAEPPAIPSNGAAAPRLPIDENEFVRANNYIALENMKIAQQNWLFANYGIWELEGSAIKGGGGNFPSYDLVDIIPPSEPFKLTPVGDKLVLHKVNPR